MIVSSKKDYFLQILIMVKPASGTLKPFFSIESCEVLLIDSIKKTIKKYKIA